ncbi:MAG TPA: proteinase inhibitor I42, chagasin [Mesotoga sp.]|nr:proteinase inhibitor I42, chagasin [Mesotoga sp.]
MRSILAVFLLVLSAVCSSFSGQIVFNGNLIYYEIEGTEGELVVVISDGPGLDSSYMTGIFQERRILRYDHLGSGKSENSSSIDIDFQYYISELAALIYSLDLNSFHLVGHGFGSAVAVGLALTNPPGLLSLVVVNPRLNYPAIDLAISELRETEPTNGFDKYNFLLGGISTEDRAKGITDDLINRAAYSLFWGEDPASIEGRLRGLDLSSGLPDLRVPILVCVGIKSFPGIAHTSAYQSGAPNSEFVTFMNSGHFPMIEEKAAFELIVDGFFKRVEENSSIGILPKTSREILQGNPGDRVFGQEDLERNVNMHISEDFTVMLPSSPGAGYSWKISSFDEDIVRLISDPFYEEPIEQGNGYDVFSFRVVGSGSTRITFSFGSIWDETPMRTCSMSLDVEEYSVEPLTITTPDSGKTFIVGLNEPIEVVLESPVDSDLKWRIASTNPGILRQPEESETRVSENPLYAAKVIEQVYYFEGMNYGTASVRFDYGSSWEDLPPERTFEATIVVAEPVRECIIIQDSDNGRTIEIGIQQSVFVKLKKSSDENSDWQISSCPGFEVISGPYAEEYMDVRYTIFHLKPTGPGEVLIEFAYGGKNPEASSAETFTIRAQIAEKTEHLLKPGDEDHDVGSN